MAGIVFPDVAGSVLPALQIQKSQQLMDLEAARQRKLDEEQTRQQAAGQYVPGALAGDQDAFNNLAKYNPDLAIKLRMFSADKHQKEMQLAREGAQALSQGAGAVLQADPGQRADAYQAYLTSMKARGIDVSAMPPQYSPAVDSLLNYHFNTGVGADKLLELRMKQPGVLPDSGSGGPPVPGSLPGGATPEQQQQFIQAMTPHALAVAQQTGQDPRLVLAQAALETGYGQHAPGNNYFGIKGGNGPALQTNEAGPGGQLVPTQAQFRSYRGPGESASDYASLISTDPHYAGVRSVVQNGGDLAAQIDAMGKSGYATDPNYAAKLRQIAFTLPTISNQQPVTGAVPPQMMAYGRNAAQMPNVAPGQVGAVPGVPVQMPQPPQFANGMVPGMPVGGDQIVNQPGVMPQPAPPPPIQSLHDYVRAAVPGARLAGNQLTQEPLYDHNGYVGIFLPNGKLTYIPPPPKGGTFADVHQNPNDPNSPIIAQRNTQTNELHPRNMAGQIVIPPELADVHGDQLKQSAWYQSLPVTVRNNAEGLVTGDVPISTLSKRAGGGAEFNTTVGIAQQLLPGWSPNEGVQRQIFEKSLADGNSKNGQSVQAMNIAPLHAADLLKLTDAINQQNPQAVQGIINKLKEQFGDTAVPNMNAARNLVALEFLRAAVGPGALNQALEQQFIQSINTASTADQTRSVIAGYVDKLMGRANEMIDTGKLYNPNFNEKQIIRPRTQEALDYIKGPRIGAPGTPQAGQPVPPTPSFWDRVFGGGSGNPGGAPAPKVRKFNPATGALE